MTQPVNPNTDLPMSLRMERIQQARQIQNSQQQGFIAQQAEHEKKLKQQRVNENSETDKAKIRDEEKGKKEKKERQDKNKQKMKGKEQGGDEEEKNLLADDGKGQIIDIKV